MQLLPTFCHALKKKRHPIADPEVGQILLYPMHQICEICLNFNEVKIKNDK